MEDPNRLLNGFFKFLTQLLKAQLNLSGPEFVFANSNYF